MKQLNYESYKTFWSCKNLPSFKRIITYNVLPHHRLCNDICESVGFFSDLCFHFSLSITSHPPSLPVSFLQYFPVKKSINLAWSCSNVLVFQVALYLSSAVLTLNATGLAKCGNRHDSSVIEGKCLKLVLRTLSPEHWIKRLGGRLETGAADIVLGLYGGICHLYTLWWGIVWNRICSLAFLHPLLCEL